ncbi:hypothetical protein MMC22_009812 [Lobaria immixta]|nr:hypothetical protein [Lobaria immixta]
MLGDSETLGDSKMLGDSEMSGDSELGDCDERLLVDSDIECLALATAMCNVMPKTMSLATPYGNDSKSDRKAEEVMIELVVENFDFQISNLKFQISNLKSQISNLKSQISNLKKGFESKLPIPCRTVGSVRMASDISDIRAYEYTRNVTIAGLQSALRGLRDFSSATDDIYSCQLK